MPASPRGCRHRCVCRSSEPMAGAVRALRRPPAALPVRPPRYRFMCGATGSRVRATGRPSCYPYTGSTVEGRVARLLAGGPRSDPMHGKLSTDACRGGVLRPRGPGGLCSALYMEPGRTTSRLLDVSGMTAAELYRARRDGELERVRRGSYAAPERIDDASRHRRLAAATFPLLAGGSVLSHATAAVVHGLPISEERVGRVWVTRPGSGHGRRGPVVHLRRSPLAASDVVVVDGLAVTSLARTAIDVARELPFEWGVVICDAVLARGASREELAEVVERTRRWPGGRRAWAALRFADPSSGSPAESLSRVQIERLGFPPPSTQFRVVRDGVLVATTDFGWEDYRLVGECDGRIKYGELLRPGETPADAVMREKRREERIRQAGFWIVRWGWREANDPAELGRILRRAFELAPGESEQFPSRSA